MRKQRLVILFSLLTGLGIHTASSQDLLGTLYGKWNMTKYQSRIKTKETTGTLVFESDGGIISEGAYFGSGKGFFTTDETRSLVVIETAGVKSEWMASVRKGVLKLRTPSGTRQKKIQMTFEKVKV